MLTDYLQIVWLILNMLSNPSQDFQQNIRLSLKTDII